MDGKIEELKKEKRTLKTSITKVLNELAPKLLTKMPNKENVMTLTCDGMNCWSCWTHFKPCMEKISMHRWGLQQVMKRIK